MDSKLVAATLRSYSRWLEREIEVADKALRGLDLERNVERNYIGPGNPLFGTAKSEDAKDPKNWEEIEKDALVLDGLRAIVDCLNDEVSAFRGE